MPSYSYVCPDCNLKFSEFMSVQDARDSIPVPCGACGCEATRDWSKLKNITGHLTCRTLGMQAEKNNSTLSGEAKREIWKKNHDYLFDKSNGEVSESRGEKLLAEKDRQNAFGID